MEEENASKPKRFSKLELVAAGNKMEHKTKYAFYALFKGNTNSKAKLIFAKSNREAHNKRSALVRGGNIQFVGTIQRAAEVRVPTAMHITNLPTIEEYARRRNGSA